MYAFIDLNADLGEGFGVYRYGSDDELIPLVSSVNIACGWHGGDPAVIRRAVSLAVQNGVTVGSCRSELWTGSAGLRVPGSPT